ncbi:MAG TPA: M23 family metallopeptidase [Anaerolineales bacterium]|nr:M23 family metallopeptidase [Anaerolineales bacterium]
MATPIVVDFPLRGEWIAPNTPGTKVPSHGTNMLGARYAYDFVGIDPNSRSRRFYRPGPLHYLIFGVRLQDCFGWGKPIYSATAGTVVQAEDGWPERNPVHFARDVFLQFQNARSFSQKTAADRRSLDLRTLTGNFIIVASSEGYAVYAHAQTGSIRVSTGDKVVPGQQIANVGHSGNSTAPHLHFQMMDRQDSWEAQGLPCCFRDYEVFDEGAWRLVQNGIPKATDRIRKL